MRLSGVEGNGNLEGEMAKAKRITLNKQIASAPTLAKKWEAALHGGPPPTAVQRLRKRPST
jgi:hypothetical protein